MLDIQKIINEKDKVREALLKRMKKVDLDKIINLDDECRVLITKINELKAERNKFSKTRPSDEIIQQMKELGNKVKNLEAQLKNVETKYKEKLLDLPNIPADDVKAGGKENDEVIYTYKEKPKFDFKFKDHIGLAKSLGIIDYERSAKMSGSGFWTYVGDGALLEWALLNYFIDFNQKNGYVFLIPPFLLNEKSAYISGHLPKFRNDLFWTKDGLCLNPTAEMMLGNYHRDEILDKKKLPLKYFAFSTCFRREAGAYRTEERGMIRGHQFNKVELFQFAKPEDSWQAFDELKDIAEKLVRGLNLHFQISQLAAGDTSDVMAKTIDVEVYFPSMEKYKEVSSISNALDYQARRGNIRFKSKTGKNEFVHTLNASGLATSRLLPAILEQNQQKDGSVKIPKILRKYLPFKKIIPKKAK